MSKKIVFSICLVSAGLVIGLLVIFTYGMSGGNAAITLGCLFLAVACIITGSILAFSRLLDRTVDPLVDEIHADIEDDIQDLKEHRFTSTFWMVVIMLLAGLAFSFFAFRFHKMEAAWGPVPVLVPTLIGLLALAWFIPRTRWFRYSRDHTPMWIFFIPTIGLIISLWLGLANTENMDALRATSTEPVIYNAIQPAGLLFQGAGEVADFGFAFDLPSCDDDACGVILLVVGLIILTFVLVIGSAFIPHFWILSGSLLLGVMLLIAIHDLRQRPYQKPSETEL